MGAEVLVRHKGMAVPIVSAQKKGIFIESRKGTKRLPWSTICKVQPQMGISKRFVSVEDFQYSYFYQGESRWETDAHNSTMSRERDTNMAIAAVSSSANLSSEERQEQIQALTSAQNEYERQMDTLINDGELRADGYGDSVRVKMTLMPTADIQNAYCAIMTDYMRADGTRLVSTKIEWLGDLLKDIPEEVDFTQFLAEGDYSQSRTELHLFSGNSKLIPTTLSKALKELSVDEMNTLLTGGN